MRPAVAFSGGERLWTPPRGLWVPPERRRIEVPKPFVRYNPSKRRDEWACPPIGWQLAPNIVQHNTNTAYNPSTQTVAYGSSVTAGSLLVCSSGFQGNAGTTIAISDTNSNLNWKQATIGGPQAGLWDAIWYNWNAKAGATSVIATTTGTGLDHLDIIIQEYSGVQTASDPGDGAHSAISVFTSNLSCGNFTTTVNGDLIVGTFQDSFGISGVGSPTNSLGFDGYDGAVFAAWGVQATASSSTNTFPTSGGGNAVSCGAAFKAAASAAAPFEDGGRVIFQVPDLIWTPPYVQEDMAGVAVTIEETNCPLVWEVPPLIITPAPVPEELPATVVDEEPSPTIVQVPDLVFTPPPVPEEMIGTFPFEELNSPVIQTPPDVPFVGPGIPEESTFPFPFEEDPSPTIQSPPDVPFVPPGVGEDTIGSFPFEEDPAPPVFPIPDLVITPPPVGEETIGAFPFEETPSPAILTPPDLIFPIPNIPEESFSTNAFPFEETPSPTIQTPPDVPFVGPGVGEESIFAFPLEETNSPAIRTPDPLDPTPPPIGEDVIGAFPFEETGSPAILAAPDVPIFTPPGVGEESVFAFPLEETDSPTIATPPDVPFVAPGIGEDTIGSFPFEEEPPPPVFPIPDLVVSPPPVPEENVFPFPFEELDAPPIRTEPDVPFISPGIGEESIFAFPFEELPPPVWVYPIPDLVTSPPPIGEEIIAYSTEEGYAAPVFAIPDVVFTPPPIPEVISPFQLILLDEDITIPIHTYQPPPWIIPPYPPEEIAGTAVTIDENGLPPFELPAEPKWISYEEAETLPPAPPPPPPPPPKPPRPAKKNKPFEPSMGTAPPENPFFYRELGVRFNEVEIKAPLQLREEVKQVEIFPGDEDLKKKEQGQEDEEPPIVEDTPIGDRFERLLSKVERIVDKLDDRERRIDERELRAAHGLGPKPSSTSSKADRVVVIEAQRVEVQGVGADLAPPAAAPVVVRASNGPFILGALVVAGVAILATVLIISQPTRPAPRPRSKKRRKRAKVRR